METVPLGVQVSNIRVFHFSKPNFLGVYLYKPFKYYWVNPVPIKNTLLGDNIHTLIH